MELLPCPFCGSNEIIINGGMDNGKRLPEFHSCEKCNSQSPICNTRHSNSKELSDKEIEELLYKESEKFYKDWFDKCSPWISVKDILPEKEEPILMFYKNYICIGYMDNENDFIFDGDLMKNVTHWMPLPQPPKEP